MLILSSLTLLIKFKVYSNTWYNASNKNHSEGVGKFEKVILLMENLLEKQHQYL